MAVTTKSGQLHANTGSSTLTQTNALMVTAPALSCLTKLEVSGEVSFDGNGNVQDAVASYFTCLWTHGIQFGATGYTPNAIGSGPNYDTGNWFYGALPVPSTTAAVWAPSTATGGINDRWPIKITVYPQFHSGGSATDVYYSMGPTVSGMTSGYRLFVSLRAWYE